MVSGLGLASHYIVITFILANLVMCSWEGPGENVQKMPSKPLIGVENTLKMTNKDLHKALNENEVEMLIDGEEDENVIRVGKAKLEDDPQLYTKVREFEEWR